MMTITPGVAGAVEEVPFIGAEAGQCMVVRDEASAAEAEAADERFDIRVF